VGSSSMFVDLHFGQNFSLISILLGVLFFVLGGLGRVF
jgi:hypothetical protein